MNAIEFLSKYPSTEPNENCLLDMACPKCGNRDEFRINCTADFDVSDNGTGDYYDSEWEDDDYCRCKRCDAWGKVSDFKIEGLDAEIKHRKENKQ